MSMPASARPFFCALGGLSRLASAAVKEAGRPGISSTARGKGARTPPRVGGEPSEPAEGAEAPLSGDREEDGSDTYRVTLPTFEGPLDMLLHLIQKHELDILDIPVSFVTQKYLEYMSLMRELSIDVASEYLVMAATLTHIKSKMLLPAVPRDQEDETAEEEEDPRAELVRRLLEYQKYKAAAEDLGRRETLGKDVFARGEGEVEPDGPAPFAKFGVFDLLGAFAKVLERTKSSTDHEVFFDRISITDRIMELTAMLRAKRSVPFEDLFLGSDPEKKPARFEVVITFLAILEMCRLRMMSVYQAEPLEPIFVELLIVKDDDDEVELADRRIDDSVASPDPYGQRRPRVDARAGETHRDAGDDERPSEDGEELASGFDPGSGDDEGHDSEVNAEVSSEADSRSPESSEGESSEGESSERSPDHARAPDVSPAAAYDPLDEPDSPFSDPPFDSDDP